MKRLVHSGRVLSSLVTCALAAFLLLTCTAFGNRASAQEPSQERDTSSYLVAIDDEPDTVDFQCTSIYYTVANNVFNRLVETNADSNGNAVIAPSLAESWDVSDDGLRYTFHLREGVTFSNGSPLTSSDVLYSFTRLLSHPNSCNHDILDEVVGADELESGKTNRLEGFSIADDHTFTITLVQPFEAFLSCLSMPGASIMDEETTAAAGDRFGIDPSCTIGTGPFVLGEWTPGKGMLLDANRDCWAGPPRCDGVDLRFTTASEQIKAMYETGELDILDLEDVPDYADYYIHGDIYQKNLFHTQRIEISYIALNESVEPLGDVRVRKALQLALDRQTLLDAVYSGRGYVENGIFPHGLYGFNPDLEEIPFDPQRARELLQEAGLGDGFSLAAFVRSSSQQQDMTLMRLAAAMWEEVGVHTTIEVLSESRFMELRKSGKLPCYTASWMADYDDPDNFIYTFFGNAENTTFRSLCYGDNDVMKRVRAARTIDDAKARIQEYQDLERKIVGEDAAWIPLCSRFHYYSISDRVDGIPVFWNGSMKSRYCDVAIRETP